MAPCSLPLRTWGAQGSPSREDSLPYGKMGSPPTRSHREAAQAQLSPILTSWRVVAYFRMPFSSTKYLWGQRETEVNPYSPHCRGLNLLRAGHAAPSTPLPCASPSGATFSS